MLEISNLYAGYDKLKVLHNVALTVKPGELVALIGPNGAGKSTILKAIYNIATVTKGKICFNEQNIRALNTHELLEVGISYVPQGRVNFGTLSVLENLEIGGEVHKDKEVMHENLKNVFSKFPVLKRKQHDLAQSLSGGEQQMLAIGRALMQNPRLLLLDEPTLGLSPILQQELFALLQKLKDEDGLSLLIVEQNAKKAIKAADHTYVLEDGKIVLHGGKEILQNKKIKSIYLGGK